MKYKSQLRTQTLIVETVPPLATVPGAIVYVNIPKDMNIFRVSIWNDESILGVPVPVAGGVCSFNGQHFDDYHFLVLASRDKVPYVMESKNGYIVDGFYLAVLSQVVGEGCIFHILFEGEQ